jgi:hypothetical protein
LTSQKLCRVGLVISRPPGLAAPFAPRVDRRQRRRAQRAVNKSKKKPETLRVTWEALASEVGDCLQLEPEMDPPRWRTVRWPSKAVIEKLRRVAMK